MTTNQEIALLFGTFWGCGLCTWLWIRWAMKRDAKAEAEFACRVQPVAPKPYEGFGWNDRFGVNLEKHMIELRWVSPDGERPGAALQWRLLVAVDASGAICPGPPGEWLDVPFVAVPTDPNKPLLCCGGGPQWGHAWGCQRCPD